MAKHLKCKKHLEIENIIPNNFYTESSGTHKIKLRKGNPKPSRETARKKFKKMKNN